MFRLFLLLCVAAVAAGCHKPPPPAPPPAPAPVVDPLDQLGLPEDDEPLPDHLRQEPIPQDKVRMERRRADKLARLRAEIVDAYKRIGSKDPKWDEAATAALEKVARTKATDDRDGDAVEAAAAALAEAVRLGCDDPYVRYQNVRYAERVRAVRLDSEKARDEFIAIAEALADSKYAAITRANARHNANVYRPAPTTPEGVAEALRSPEFVQVRDLLRQALADDREDGADNFIEIARLTQVYFVRVRGSRELAYEAFRDALAGVPDAVALRHWLAGQYHLDRGWAARGNAIAALVPEAKGREFVTELEAAADEFEAAWDLDPTQPKVAVGRMSVAGPFGDFEALEEWFHKAMTADGDCYQAVAVKANFLQPKWGGHGDAVRQFADRLVATRNWHAMLPIEGVNMLRTLTTHGMGHRVVDGDWPTVEAAFEALLKERPDSRWAWSLYAKVAAEPRRPAVILRAAEHVGGRPSPVVFGPGEFDLIVNAAKADGDRRGK